MISSSIILSNIFQVVTPEDEVDSREILDNQESASVNSIAIEIVDDDVKTKVVINNPLDICDKNNIQV